MQNQILRSEHGSLVVVPSMRVDLNSRVAICNHEGDVLVIEDNAAKAANHLHAWKRCNDVYVCNYPE